MHLKHQCHSFSYVAAPDAKILILGSMPGQRSLEKQQYYAHPQNIFWEIIERAFGAGRGLEYNRRLAVLKKHQIALWDVVFRCKRSGSLDSDIETSTVVPNDFKQFFYEHQNIRTILFNGQKAEELFIKLVLKDISDDLQSIQRSRLPSTSPAHASLSKKEKISSWLQGLAVQNHYVYIIRCKNNKYYTGYTINIESRIEKHKLGLGSKFTRSFGVSKLVYCESCSTKSEALKREAQIKSWSRVEKEELINSGLNKIHELNKG